MKTLALMTAVALGGAVAYSDEKPESNAACPSGDCTCTVTLDGVQCGDSAWLDIETITVAAEDGNPIAQYAIAYITDNGLNNTPQDPERAQELYSQAKPGLEKAAGEGNAAACGALAHMYATGKGVDKDPAKAKEYAQRCKDCKGNPKAPSKDASAPSSDAQSM